VLQGGNELCLIEGFDRGKTVSELKVSIEAEAGLVPASTRLINPKSLVELQDYLTLEDAGMPSEQEGVIQLYAQKLKKVVVADELQIAPGEVTDSELAVLCDSIKDDPPDILVLCGCHDVTNICCLVQLSTISHLDISSCNLGAEGGFHLAGVIKDMGAMTCLNLASNDLGKLVLPTGWEEHGTSKGYFRFEGGDWAQEVPAGTKADGIIALAAAIPDMEALTSLNLASNDIGGYFDDDIAGTFIATPEGTATLIPIAHIPRTVFLIAVDIRRTYCSCWCHQGYGGHIVSESPQEQHWR
jgi:hypothetical protein